MPLLDATSASQADQDELLRPVTCEKQTGGDLRAVLPSSEAPESILRPSRVSITHPRQASTAPALLDLIMVDKPPQLPPPGGSEDRIQKLERMEKARRNSQAVALSAAVQTLATPEIIQRQLRCSRWLVFRRPMTETEWRLAAANFCGLTHSCEACAVARGSKLLASLVPDLLGVLSAKGMEAHLVTFTVRNGSSLSETFARLDGALKATMKHRENSKRRKRLNSFSECIGGVGQIETKKGRSGGWHPHYHGVWIFRSRPDYGEIREQWEHAAGEPSNMDVRRLKSESLRGTLEHRDQLVKDLCEVVKYSLKFDSHDAEMLWHAASFYRSKRARLFRRFGILKGCEEPDNFLDECPNWEHIDYVERIFAWQAAQGRYLERPEIADIDLQSSDEFSDVADSIIQAAR